MIALDEQCANREHQSKSGDPESQRPARSGTGQAIPGRGDCDPETDQNGNAEKKPRKDDVDTEDDEDCGGHKSGERGETIDLLELHRQTIRRDGRFARDPRS
ncbi:MAG: hypothetical protein AB7T48_01800 [Solirubrobacterales bacterium]